MEISLQHFIGLFNNNLQSDKTGLKCVSDRMNLNIYKRRITTTWSTTQLPTVGQTGWHSSARHSEVNCLTFFYDANVFKRIICLEQDWVRMQMRGQRRENCVEFL